ncbi:MAG TPA: zinc ribbon domain-containing protein [Pseudogracilibacillus sp.]|nr:zinc ribbon domain-containing protein [Pseudogracilibacillus sp.]
MSKKCPNCDCRISDEAFCPNCGIAQQCINCETPFKAMEKFCGRCGTKRQNPSIIEEEKNQDRSTRNDKVQQTTSEQKPLNKKLSPNMIGTFILVIIILLILIINPFSKSDEKKLRSLFLNFSMH